MAGGFRKYELPFILKTLSILNINNHDVHKTAYETGIDTKTINRWMKRYGVEYKERIQALMTARAAVDMSESMELYRQSATTEIEKVKEMIISQMKAVVPRTRSLSQLSQAYKTLHECINGIKDGSIPENKSFMAIFNMQINAMKGKMEDETKDIDYEPTDD